MIPSRTSVKPNTASGCSDGDVGACHEPRATAERVSLDRADDGSGAGVDRLEHAEEPHSVLDVLVVGEVDRRALPLDVGTGAEARAVAGEHDRARVPDVGERLGQLCDQRGVEGVPPLGTGQRDAQDVRRRVRPEAPPSSKP